MRRTETRDDVERIGNDLNALRQRCLENHYIYTAGLIRAAEEAMMVAFQALNDRNVAEGDL